MREVRVLLVDDHEMIRDGLKTLIDARPDMRVVGEATNGRLALEAAQRLKPDVVIMDVSMPELNGLKATRQLKKLCPHTQIVAFTRHADQSYLHELFRAGASGYVLKKSASVELVRSIAAVANGHIYLDSEMIGPVVEMAVHRRSPSAPTTRTQLSAREEEILRHTAMGYANREIAARLSISVKTVEAHKANAMSKMAMKNRIDIVRYALLQGWLEDR
jgi:two-component system response regulator NreC